MRIPFRCSFLIIPVVSLTLQFSCSLDLRGILLRGLVKLDPPVISASDANRHKNALITIKPPEPGASIYYTTDKNADPLQDGKLYTESFLFIGSKPEPGSAERITIKAVARSSIGGVSRKSVRAIRTFDVTNNNSPAPKSPFKFILRIFDKNSGGTLDEVASDPIDKKYHVDFDNGKPPVFRVEPKLPLTSIPPNTLFFYTANGTAPAVNTSNGDSSKWSPLNNSTMKITEKSGVWEAELPELENGRIIVVAFVPKGDNGTYLVTATGVPYKPE